MEEIAGLERTWSFLQIPQRAVAAVLVLLQVASLPRALFAEEPVYELAPLETIATPARGWGTTAEVRLAVQGTDLFGRQIESGADWLRGLPGVYHADAFGGNDLPKLSLRGSDLAAFPSKKGVLILRDGLPVNFADGSFVLGLLSPLNASMTIAVGQGPLAPAHSTLGGIIEYTGVIGSASPRAQMAMSFGTAGRRQASWQQNVATPNGMLAWALHGRRSDGFREHSDQRGEGVELAAMWRVGNQLHIHAGFEWLAFGFEVPGPVNANQLATAPSGVSAGFVPGVGIGVATLRDLPRRTGDSKRLRLGVGQGSDTHRWNLGFQAAVFDDQFVRPIALGIEVSRYADVAMAFTYEWNPARVHGPLGIMIDGLIQHGRRSGEWFHNEAGERGPSFAQMKLPATSGQIKVALDASWPQLRLGAALQASSAQRRIRDRTEAPFARPGFGAAPPPPAPPPLWGAPVNLDQRFEQLLPSLQWEYRFTDSLVGYVRLSRAWEAPVMDDLLHFSGGSPNRGPSALQVEDLRPQRMRSVEVGWVVQTTRREWLLTGYLNTIKDEILTLSDGGAVSRSLNAASPTRHHGIELSVDETLLQNVAILAGGGLRTRWVLDWTHYRFSGDPRYGNNRLPGVPPLRLHAEFPLTFGHGYQFIPAVDMRIGDTPVDFANSAFLPPVTLLHLRFGRTAAQGRIAWFFEVRNALDRRHAASSIIVERLATPLAAAYFPAEGRNLRAGIAVSW